MTHSLHRLGSVESLKADYVVLTFRNSQGSFSALKIFLLRKFPYVYASLKKFLSRLGVLEAFRPRLKESDKVIKKSAVFNSREKLYSYLKMLKEADTGRSVVVSGLIDEVNSCLRELGLRPHTIQFSLGFFGKKELLPKKEILEITTMCGHHLIAPWLVENLASDVAKGKISRDEAAEMMGKLCVCDVFNGGRCAQCIEAVSR